MTDKQRTQIKDYRKEGYGYKKISQLTGVCENTVKSFCRRNGLGGNAGSMKLASNESLCKCCGVPVKQTPGRKQKIFCSDHCRNKWWNAHLSLVNRKAYYEYTCPTCGKVFTVYGNANRKYCSHECYITNRFGGIRHV